MANKNRPVSISVHPLYFDRVFEPERRKLQDKLGVNFSQTKFTEYLVRSNSKIVYPKNKNTFAPKRSKRGGFILCL